MFDHALMFHYQSRQHWGQLEQPTGSGKAYFPRCGDKLFLELRVEDDVLTQLAYRGYGCAPAIAVGSAGAELVLGKTVDQARQLQASELDEALGGLVPSKQHAVQMFLHCLEQCLTTPHPPDSKTLQKPDHQRR